MKSVEYKLLSGDTQSRSINVVVDANSTSATICWPYVIILGQECASCVYPDTNCQAIPIAPNTSCVSGNTISGNTMWNGLEVFYIISQRKAICPCDDEEKVYNVLIEDKKWVSPREIYCHHESKEITLHYEYYHITEQCDGTIKKEIIKRDVPVSAECECDESTGTKDGQYEAEETFVKREGDKDIEYRKIPYQYQCIVDENIKCKCKDLEIALNKN